MNIVDLLILAVIAICVISGMYRGFLSSLLATGGMLAAWAIAYAFYPQAAGAILNNGTLVQALNYYADAASRLGTGIARTGIANVTGEALQRALDTVALPAPFDALLQRNIVTQAYSSLNLTTLGEYFSQTLVTVVVSLVCFLVLFAVCFIVINTVINLVNHVVRFPAIRHFDAIAGGVLGLARGYLLVYLVFSLVPVLLTAVPVQFVSDYISASRLGEYFLNANFISTIITAIMK